MILCYTRVIYERFRDQLGIIKRYRNGLFTLLTLIPCGRGKEEKGGEKIPPPPEVISGYSLDYFLALSQSQNRSYKHIDWKQYGSL